MPKAGPGLGPKGQGQGERPEGPYNQSIDKRPEGPYDCWKRLARPFGPYVV